MNVCFYGAASADISENFTKVGEDAGYKFAKKGHNLVFGGGSAGMMGAVARGMHKGGAKIIGVAPTFFDVDGILFENCDELIRTETMRQRKQTMEDLSDAFVTTPGGMGTFEEFFEILTLKQLGRHQKPMIVLNIDGYYDTMIKFLDEAIEKKFMTEKCRSLYYVTDSVEDALFYLENYKAEAFNILELRRIKTN